MRQGRSVATAIELVLVNWLFGVRTMFRELAIWIYTRMLSGVFAIAAAGLSALGLVQATTEIELTRTGIRLPGIVAEMRAEKAPADLRSFQLSEAPPQTATPEKATAQTCTPRQAPVVKYLDQSGKEQVFTSADFACPSSFKINQSVVMLVHPHNPESRRIDTGHSDYFSIGFIAAFAVLMGVAAWSVRPRREMIEKLFDEPPFRDEKPILALADCHATKGSAPSAGVTPLNGIVASAEFIAKGEVPLDLCEFCAYMSTLAYERIREDGVDTSTIRVVDYLNDPRNFPSHNGSRPFEHIRTFSGGSTEGFGFVVDGAAFIVLRGTMGWADWKGNLDAWPTAPSELLPAGMELAPPRHPGFAKGWAAISSDVQKWIGELPLNGKMPFIISGHSLGGALAFLAAWELASQGRQVAAVITFGAALPGTHAFAEDYKRLGLDQRTLQLEFTQDIVPEAQKLIGYVPVGHVWEPKQLPFISLGAALAALPVVALVAWLQGGLVPWTASSSVSGTPASGQSKPSPVQTKAKADTRPIRARAFSWLRRFIVFAAFSSVLALAAHKMQKRYGLALSIMSYRKIRERRLAMTGHKKLSDVELAGCYDELCNHLRVIRGSTPDSPGPYTTIPSLPRKISSPADMRWFNTFFPARSW